MSPLIEPAILVVLAHVAAPVGLSWIYFRTYRMPRPPLGVLDMGDVAIMIGGIVLVPYLYLALPEWLVAGLIGIGLLSQLYFVAEPVLRRRWAIWLAVIALGGAEIGALRQFGALSRPYLLVNNIVQIITVVSIANLWAQSGMQARSLALLAGMLTIYDGIATWQLPLMRDLISHMSDLPFAPLVAWPVDNDGGWMGIGLGDLLLAAVFPLVMRKAFGRTAGITALVSSLGVFGVLLALPLLGIVNEVFPVMVVLGPLIVLHYSFWRRRGQERTMGQYLQAERQDSVVIHAF